MQLFNPIQGAIAPIFQKRLKDEYSAHFFYSDFANWCDNNGYLNAARYFRGEAAAELEHAMKLQKFLNDWGVSYEIERPSSPKIIGSLPEGINMAYDIEVALYEAYNSNAIGFMHTDISAFNLATEMVSIQYESVAEYRTIKDQMRHYDTSDKFQLAVFEHETFE